MNATREWSGLILESRIEYGSAARHNRGRYAGTKVHKLRTEYVVGVVPGTEHYPGSYGAIFRGEPLFFRAYPACGCTQGQRAGKPNAELTAADITCSRCKENV